MSAPYWPPDGCPPVIPALSPAGHQTPQSRFIPPKQTRCWARFTDGRWRPCDLMARARGRRIMTDEPYWLVHLRLLVDGRGEQSTGWYVFGPEEFQVR